VANMIDASSSHGDAVLFACMNGDDPVSAIAARTTKQTNVPMAKAQSRRLPRSHNRGISAAALARSTSNVRASAEQRACLRYYTTKVDRQNQCPSTGSVTSTTIRFQSSSNRLTCSQIIPAAEAKGRKRWLKLTNV
jgi:sugar/nucleoside kinase (ribokinase family)